MKHKSDDYKISAVKYYLKIKTILEKHVKYLIVVNHHYNDGYKHTKTSKNITRKNRKPISYKINKEQVKTAVNMIDNNEQITMDELLFDTKHKYNTFDIMHRHLGRVIRANNRTRH